MRTGPIDVSGSGRSKPVQNLNPEGFTTSTPEGFTEGFTQPRRGSLGVHSGGVHSEGSLEKDVDLNLLASVAGTYEAPASSAYLYYTAEDKAWTEPVKVAIDK